jgi:hypothetical protein
LRRAPRAGWLVAGSAAVLVAAGLLFGSQFHHGQPPFQQVMRAPSGASLPPAGKHAEGGREPAPFTYDARNNRHWDPAHHHWHFGRPPSEAERAARPAGPTVDPRELAGFAGPIRTVRDSGAKVSTPSR